MKKSTLLVISSSVWFVYVEKPETYTIRDDVTLIGGGDVQYNSIGKNIRRFRTEKKMRQEDLAERAGLSTNYIGMVERGEKIPSLESFIGIVNALGVSADMILADVLDTGYEIKHSLLNDKLKSLSKHDRERIYAVIDTMIQNT
jgi:transcriptional regulator with XRE-family HTH domain